VFPFRTSNVIRSVQSSHLCRHRKFPVPPPLGCQSDRSLIGSPRWDFTFIRKVALPARTRCVSRQTISRRISASGDVANVNFLPCPTHFLIAHKTTSLSHNRRMSSLRAADCNASTIPPNAGLIPLAWKSNPKLHPWVAGARPNHQPIGCARAAYAQQTSTCDSIARGRQSHAHWVPV
jgi:hypothetical protein